jgi:hypothetical protein
MVTRPVPSHERRSARIACLAAVVVSVFVGGISLSAEPATANTFGPADNQCNSGSLVDVCFTDGPNMSYAVAGVTSETDNAVNWAMWNSVVDTVLTPNYEPSGGDANTNVVATDWNFGSSQFDGAFAYTICQTAVSGTEKCHHTQINFNTQNGTFIDLSAAWQKKVACHEIGHAMGLGHYVQGTVSWDDHPDSCLRQGTWSGGPANARYYDWHDKTHLAGRY